jgi:hypothetical protein
MGPDAVTFEPPSDSLNVVLLDLINLGKLLAYFDGISLNSPVVMIADKPCFPDCDATGTLNIDDFVCFQTAYSLGDKAKADCDADGTLTIDDFICFQTAFVLGC